MYDSNDDDETTTDDDEGEEEARSAMGGGASGIRVLLGAAAASTAASAIGVKRERLSPTVGEALQSVGTAAASERMAANVATRIVVKILSLGYYFRQLARATP